MQKANRLFLTPSIALAWASLLTAMLIGLEIYSGPSHGKLGLALHNSAHGPFFFILALVLERLLGTTRLFGALSNVGKSLALLLILTLLAIATEAVQIWTPRDASWGDVATNLLGAAAGVAWITATRRNGRARSGLQKALLRTLALLLLLWSTMPALTAVAAHALRSNREPDIFSADQILPRYFLTATGTRIDVVKSASAGQPGDHSARVEFLDRNWPGVSIDPFPDWRRYKVLKLSMSLAGDESMDLHIRVNDFQHNEEYSDRFNIMFSLQPGENILAVPINDIETGPAARRMVLENIERIVLFSTRRWHGRVIYLNRIWLE